MVIHILAPLPADLPLPDNTPISRLVLLPLQCSNHPILVMLELQPCLGFGVLACPHLADDHGELRYAKAWVFGFYLLEYLRAV